MTFKGFYSGVTSLNGLPTDHSTVEWSGVEWFVGYRTAFASRISLCLADIICEFSPGHDTGTERGKRRRGQRRRRGGDRGAAAADDGVGIDDDDDGADGGPGEAGAALAAHRVGDRHARRGTQEGRPEGEKPSVSQVRSKSSKRVQCSKLYHLANLELILVTRLL